MRYAHRPIAWFLGCFILLSCDANEGVTALMKAADAGENQRVNQLISTGKDVNQLSEHGWSALIFAARGGHLDVVKTLISAGADVNVVTKPVPPEFFATRGDYPWTTALAEAIYGGHLEVARTLIAAGANIDARALALAGGKGDIQFVELLTEKGGDLNQVATDTFAKTALHEAARKGDAKMAKWLIDRGAKTNLENTFPLREAIEGNSFETVKLLLESGADVNEVVIGQSALMKAVDFPIYLPQYKNAASKNRNLKIIELLLNYGADETYKTRNSLEINIFERVQDKLKRRQDKNADSTIVEYYESMLDIFRSHNESEQKE